MNGHASINRLFRLVWSDARGGWIAVAENARGRGKASGRSKLAAALFAGLGLASGASAQPAPPAPGQLPTGGKVAAGSIAITQSGNRLDVTQASQRGAVDWATFNVGSQAQVNFAQPSAASVTLNRVQDTQASQIFGRITSNGQVFLSNPNGVYFGPTASVDVGGLVATTHTMGTAEFMAGSTTFSRNGATGSVVNDGSLTSSLGGYIALLAPEVRNHGIVTAQAGTVAFAAGDQIELQFGNSKSVAGVLVSPSTLAALVENGSAVRAPGGLIVMSAQAADRLQGAVVRNSGTLEATAMTTRGGKIVLDSAGLVDNAGSADVSGPQGGSISVRGDRMLSAGVLRADGAAQGGTVSSTLANGLVETHSAVISATGGGVVSVDGGAGQVYSSGTYDADGRAAGQHGGSVVITADKVALMGARVSADGHDGGGSVLVGGDLHGGNAAVANATTTTVGQGVSLSADATVQGNGGKVVVWSDDTTRFAGSVSARGGATRGNGGQLEVSGKGTLYFNGSGDASAAHGSAGNLLLDPKNIVIADEVSAQTEYIDPHNTSAGTFGTTVQPLSTTSGSTVTPTGYVVITNPTDTLGATNAGAAYLFRQSDHALISTLYGTHINDGVGDAGPSATAVTVLTNGNFVVGSYKWNDGRGAATWGSGTTGWGNGATVAVGSSNSLVGSTGTHTSSQGYATSDFVGGNNQVHALPNGNYVVGDGLWNDSRGAAAFGDGSTGTSGVISAANALVGSTPMSITSGSIPYLFGDSVGSAITVLPNSNYVVDVPAWSTGVGAVALGSGSSGLSGTVSASTALVGTTSRSDPTGYGAGTDQVGKYLTVLTGSQFIFWSSVWNTDAGAVTWSNGTTLPTGVLSASNSLVGAAGDRLASGNVAQVTGHNAYVISSPSWNSGLGAATYVPYGTDVQTLNVATAGVVGTAGGDAIGSQSVAVLADGNYVLSSPGWNAGRGAVTVVDGSTGKTIVGQGSNVSAGNSLVGSVGTDHVGERGIVALTGSNDFLALSPSWSDGGTAKVGAVTWSADTTPTVGAVSAGNSLVGTYANDRIGLAQYDSYSGSATPIDNQNSTVTALSNGNYVVASPMWNGTRGAVTWGNGSTGSVGAVTASNSLVGSNAGDFVGALASPAAAVGGAPAFYYLGNGVVPLGNGNFVVVSDFWQNASAAHAGAVTWSDGSGSPTVGPVSASNSLVGSTAEDLLGYNNGQNGVLPLLAGYDSNGVQLYTGNYVVLSDRWDNGSVVDAGAVSWGSGTGASIGAVSDVNSVVGLKASGFTSRTTVTPLAVSGNYVVFNPLWDNGAVVSAGAASFVDGSTGHLSDYAANGNHNVVGAANSLVGSHAGDMTGGAVYQLLNVSPATHGLYDYSGNYLVVNIGWDNGALANAGAVSWGGATTGVSGAISRANSLVGAKAGDALGGYLTLLPNGNYVVGNPTADIGGIANAGAATWVDGTTGRLNDYVAAGHQNVVSTANSFVGSHPGDNVGNGVYSVYDATGDYATSNYFIFSTAWDCLAGALTYVNTASTPLIGVVGPGNSAVGDPNGRFVGGLNYAPYPALTPGNTAIATFGGDGGHVYDVAQAMPATSGMAIASATNFADAPAGSQMITPGYVANVLKTGTALTLQASNDIVVREAIDATGGTAGGSLTLQAGRSIAVFGDIVTGNRNLTLVANDTLAHGVNDAQRDAGIATISMGSDRLGHAAVIDAGTGAVSITLAAGADKTHALGGTVSLNSISAASITVVDKGNGLGTLSDLPTIVDCCGFTFGTQGIGADIVLNAGAALHASGTGTAVTLAADGNFTNSSGQATAAIDLTAPSARWLVYASAPGTSTFAGLDSGNTALWHQTYDPNVPIAAAGDRYVFAYQPTVTVGTQNVSKVYGTDLATGTALSNALLTVSGTEAAVAGAYLGDTLATAVSGSATTSSAGAAATAGVAGGPYAITTSLGGLSGNNGYALTLGGNPARTLTVTPKALTAALTGVTKAYDNTTAATLTSANYVLTGLVNGDTFSVGQASGSYNAASVAATTASTTLAGSDFTGLSGTQAGNYQLPTAASGSATITPKTLTGTLTGVTKVYDGNATATLASGNYVLSGFVGGQSVTVTKTTGSYDSADVAGVTSATATLAGGDFTAGGGTSLANYSLPTTVTGAATITPKALATALTGSLGKTYDGTSAATFTSANFSVTGFVGAQSATVTQTSGTYNAATVAGASTVTATLSGADYAAGSGTLLSNYQLPGSASASAAIGRASLSVSAINAAKTYDGTNVATLTAANFSLAGFVNGESATVTKTTGLYASIDAGPQTVTVGLANGDFAAGGGTQLGNYTLPTVATGSGTIARRSVTLTAPTVTKTYDGGTAWTTTAANLTALGAALVGSDTVTAATLAYASKNAGAGDRAVSLSGVTVSDGNGGANYLVSLAGNTNSTITPRTLTVGATASNRVYDATTQATVSLTDNRIANDQLNVSDSGAQFTNKNAGTGKTVNVTGLALAGADAGNYVLASNATTATADVTPAPLVIGGVAAVNRAYDTQTSVALSGTPSVSPFAGDVVLVSGNPTASVANKNAGIGKPVTVSGYAINDGNYTVVQPQGLTVDIAPAVLPLAGLATRTATKTYDGSTAVPLDGTPTVSGLNGEGVTVSGTPTGQTADKNVGSHKAITVSGLVASDPNYVVGQEPGLVATVLPAPLPITGVTAVDRAYDTRTGVALAGTPTVAPIAGDVVVLSGTPTAQAADKNAGTNKPVTVGGYTITDSNYQLVQPSGVTVNITAAVLPLAGLSTLTPSRTYDGSTAIALGGAPTVAGLAGEVVTVSGTAVGHLADKNVGSGKAVTVSGLVSSDANYVVGQEPGLVATVTPATLQVSGLTANSRPFDSTTAARLSGTPTVTPIAGDSVTATGTPAATFADPAPGTAKAVTVTGYGLAGADSGNYVVRQPIGLTADITASATVPEPITVPPATLPSRASTPALTAPTASAATSATAAAGGDILVSLVREPTAQREGAISVSVPKEMARTGTGFTFPIPTELAQAATASGQPVTASMRNGAALPPWLRYDDTAQVFIVTQPPAGGLPLEVIVRIAGNPVAVTIAER